DKGFKRTLTAMALARLCYNTLIKDGLQAKQDAKAGLITEVLENIIEANTLLSGLGFENNGCAAAHAIEYGFTKLQDTHHLYHGEKVAFGTICQLVLEQRSLAEIEEVIAFCNSVGLPTTLVDMGIKEIKEQDIMTVAEATFDSCIESEPFKVTTKNVYDAILATDEFSRRYIK
ncbi:MAG: iron-containing alcohol dehydrogenase, partial [Bacteroidales bacterium]|nr:iron-containing alcohol dehydrogenase [Bacteroidales bacterium]